MELFSDSLWAVRFGVSPAEQSTSLLIQLLVCTDWAEAYSTVAAWV